jgi:uncharacterized membrane protein
LGERITLLQGLLIFSLLSGLILVSLKEKENIGKFIFEKGTVLAFLGAIFMGSANFFMGWGSRLSDPVMANFVSDVFIAIVTGLILIFTGKFRKSFKDMFENRAVLLKMSISDKVAWLAFAFAMSLAPIAVVTALSESYIIIAVILGLAINKERIHFHQKVGLIVAVLSAVMLATVTS